MRNDDMIAWQHAFFCLKNLFGFVNCFLVATLLFKHENLFAEGFIASARKCSRLRQLGTIHFAVAGQSGIVVLHLGIRVAQVVERGNDAGLIQTSNASLQIQGFRKALHRGNASDGSGWNQH